MTRACVLLERCRKVISFLPKGYSMLLNSTSMSKRCAARAIPPFKGDRNPSRAASSVAYRSARATPPFKGDRNPSRAASSVAYRSARAIPPFKGDRKGRPYYTTNRLAKPMYSRGDPCGRPFRGWCTTMLLFCLILLAACDGSTGVTPPSDSTKTVTATRQAPTVTTAPTPTPTPTSSVAPQHFSTHVIVQGKGRPDDLVFNQSESVLLFSDF